MATSYHSFNFVMPNPGGGSSHHFRNGARKVVESKSRPISAKINAIQRGVDTGIEDFFKHVAVGDVPRCQTLLAACGASRLLNAVNS